MKLGLCNTKQRRIGTIIFTKNCKRRESSVLKPSSNNVSLWNAVHAQWRSCGGTSDISFLRQIGDALKPLSILYYNECLIGRKSCHVFRQIMKRRRNFQSIQYVDRVQFSLSFEIGVRLQLLSFD